MSDQQRPRAAIVTGAARGIGLGIAQALSAAGYGVLLADLDGEAASREAGSLPDALGIGLDVADADGWRRVVEAANSRWGRIDALVNNAGISPRDSIESTDDAQWDRTLGTNLKGPWLGIKAALPWLRQSRGRIINIGSTHCTLPLRGLFTYTVSKAGLLGLTKQVALDLLDEGITCNLVAPGWVASPGEKAIQARAGRDDFPAGIARMSEPDDAAQAVLFFLSNAARHVTGETIHLDGGLHAFGDVAAVHFPGTGVTHG
ncbi:MAG: SDR family oxidoreductase [Isosphaeraceae bacterium]